MNWTWFINNRQSVNHCSTVRLLFVSLFSERWTWGGRRKGEEKLIVNNDSMIVIIAAGQSLRRIHDLRLNTHEKREQEINKFVLTSCKLTKKDFLFTHSSEWKAHHIHTRPYTHFVFLLIFHPHNILFHCFK